ncbi:organic solvent tolerance protein OstA [Halobacteroides halobius DSM 5150]|uniref:Organic solvent tolerance protein OstA n=1 Tax=Halobacteroides halobius (strain ATCC 35273 / DSM 5150 / MD-1) TaxID=748449 RepID=L0KAJ8_HALHC|nr:LptA/OstA family protein [Halobacteroides halobius]AGB42307.1 organic solvent tolerance protein OstA [Halobacteroides halobius DSM 5150]
MPEIKVIKIAIIILVLNLACTVALANQQVNLKAKQVTYQRKKGIIIATGNVKLQTKRLNLSANRLKINLKQDKLLATGNVQSKTETGEYTSQKLNYNFKTDSGIFINSEGIIISDSLKEPFYLQAPQTSYTPNKSNLQKAEFTTCDLEEPHYHFQAESMTIYPEDKIVAYHVTLWEFNGQVPIFYWPILVYSFKNHQQIFKPQVGYNQQKGWFIKTTYNYDREDFGQLYLDYFSKLGFAIGAKHYYKTLKNDNASLYFYLEEDNRNPTLSPWISLELKREYKAEDTSYTWSVGYKDHYSNYLTTPQKNNWLNISAKQKVEFTNWQHNWGLKYRKNRSYNHDLDLSLDVWGLKDNNLDLNLDYIYQQQPKTTFNEYGVGLNYKKYFSDDLYLNYNYDYEYHAENEDNSWQYKTDLRLQLDKSKYNWSVGAKFKRDNEGINYYDLPEAQLTIHPGEIWSNKLLNPLDITVGGLNRYNDSWLEPKQQGYTRVGYEDYLSLTDNNRLHYNQQFEQNIYSTGHQHWSYQNRFDLTTKLPFGW